MWRFDTGTLDSYLETSAFLIQDGKLIDPSATLTGKVGAKVVVGLGATVECAEIGRLRSFFPELSSRFSGNIRHAILGGPVSSSGDIESSILHGDYKG